MTAFSSKTMYVSLVITHSRMAAKRSRYRSTNLNLNPNPNNTDVNTILGTCVQQDMFWKKKICLLSSEIPTVVYRLTLLNCKSYYTPPLKADKKMFVFMITTTTITTTTSTTSTTTTITNTLLSITQSNL
uniref:Uncharacterized protein n=1 Tax=Glossina brevipalpis TaxID=37001 RepID=A0A1A9WVC2_9MUSC